MSEMIWRMSWSCLRSSPCLKITGYMAPSSALKISLAGISALWQRQERSWRASAMACLSPCTRILKLHLYLEESGGLWYDPSDPDLRLQRKRNRLNLWKIHLLVVSQQSLQPLRLHKHNHPVLPVVASSTQREKQLQQQFESDLFFAISALSLHSFHQVHQSVHKCLLRSQQGPHHPHTLITLEQRGSTHVKKGSTFQS